MSVKGINVDRALAGGYPGVSPSRWSVDTTKGDEGLHHTVSATKGDKYLCNVVAMTATTNCRGHVEVVLNEWSGIDKGVGGALALLWFIQIYKYILIGLRRRHDLETGEGWSGIYGAEERKRTRRRKKIVRAAIQQRAVFRGAVRFDISKNISFWSFNYTLFSTLSPPWPLPVAAPGGRPEFCGPK